MGDASAAQLAANSVQNAANSAVQQTVSSAKLGSSSHTPTFAVLPGMRAELENKSAFQDEAHLQQPAASAPSFQDVGQTAKTNAPAAAPWVQLFKGLKLEKYEVEAGFTLEAHDVDDTITAWGHCLVGYVLGRYPGRQALLDVCNSWGVPYTFRRHPSGWTIFKFNNEEDRENVLMRGPYFSFGRVWMLKCLPSFFRFTDDCFDSFPTWITLPGLPLECWTACYLEKIASLVGSPLTTDQCTAERSRLSFARILVEVDAKKPLTRTVRFRLPNGELMEQTVLYEVEPTLCTMCNRYGHTKETCSTLTGPPTTSNSRGRSKARKSAKPVSQQPAAQTQIQHKASPTPTAVTSTATTSPHMAEQLGIENKATPGIATNATDRGKKPVDQPTSGSSAADRGISPTAGTRGKTPVLDHTDKQAVLAMQTPQSGPGPSSTTAAEIPVASTNVSTTNESEATAAAGETRSAPSSGKFVAFLATMTTEDETQPTNTPPKRKGKNKGQRASAQKQ